MTAIIKITNACEIAEAYGRQLGLATFEIDRVVHSRSDRADEWIVYLKFSEVDPLIEDDGNGAIIVVDDQTGEARLIEGL